MSAPYLLTVPVPCPECHTVVDVTIEVQWWPDAPATRAPYSWTLDTSAGEPVCPECGAVWSEHELYCRHAGRIARAIEDARDPSRCEARMERPDRRCEVAR